MEMIRLKKKKEELHLVERAVVKRWKLRKRDEILEIYSKLSDFNRKTKNQNSHSSKLPITFIWNGNWSLKETNIYIHQIWRWWESCDTESEIIDPFIFVIPSHTQKKLIQMMQNEPAIDYDHAANNKSTAQQINGK